VSWNYILVYYCRIDTELMNPDPTGTLLVLGVPGTVENSLFWTGFTEDVLVLFLCSGVLGLYWNFTGVLGLHWDCTGTWCNELDC
jgi:hypothetical protein